MDPISIAVLVVSGLVGLATSIGTMAYSTAHGDKQFEQSMAYSKQQANESIALAAAQEQRSIDQQKMLLAEQNSAETQAANVQQQITISNKANAAYNKEYRARVYGSPTSRGVK